MSDKELKKKRLSERMAESYRMVVYRAEDFKEVRSFYLSFGAIYTGLSMFSILMVALFYSLFAFTPLRKIIPGYAKVENNEQFIKLVEGVEELSYQIDAQETYLKAFRNLLTMSQIDGESPFQGKDIVYEKVEKRADKKNSISLNNKEKGSPAEIKIPNAQSDDNLEIYSTLRESDIIVPVSGVISSEFQPNIRHYGIDILAPKNTPVKAMMDGFVFSSGWDLETGYTLGIQHKGNILSFYKHNSILLKEKGTFVRAGEAVAIIGNTGTLSSGPHLHFELWHSGKPVNPKDFINFN
jgi:murein DD-endopeptidase MepM/ murein hydrolase activator NlpD